MRRSYRGRKKLRGRSPPKLFLAPAKAGGASPWPEDVVGDAGAPSSSGSPSGRRASGQRMRRRQKVYGSTPEGSITASILMKWMRRADPTHGICSQDSAPLWHVKYSRHDSCLLMSTPTSPFLICFHLTKKSAAVLQM
jgi:hypothetical protein